MTEQAERQATPARTRSEQWSSSRSRKSHNCTSWGRLAKASTGPPSNSPQQRKTASRCVPKSGRQDGAGRDSSE